MIVNVWSGIKDDLDAPILRVKIGNKHFDNHRGIHFMNRPDRAGEVIGAAVFQIIARNRGDHDMF